MTLFDQALPTVLRHEGVFSNDPQDPGGPTKYGLSLREVARQFREDGVHVHDPLFDALDVDDDGDVDLEDVRRWDLAAVGAYLKRYFWSPAYDRLTSPEIATKLFDTAVNMGPKAAHQLLQQALRRLGYPVIVDGILGENTLAAANQAAGQLLLEFRACQAERYARIVLNRSASARFLSGWMRRAVS